MQRIRHVLSALLMLPLCIYAGSVTKGFQALGIFDYFKAKSVFYSINSKGYRAASCYGLALIYQRNDNPFSNNDSASKYINLACHLFENDKLKNTNLSGIAFEKPNLLKLATVIAQQQLQKIMLHPTPVKLDKFLTTCYLADPELLAQAIQKRDLLELETIKKINRSDSTRWFILTHPNATCLTKANILLEEQIFSEITSHETKGEYLLFLAQQPNNHLVNKALQHLFDLLISTKDKSGLAEFVAKFPKASQANEAWKSLFALSVQAYSSDELNGFISKFPNFPLKNTILQELALSKVTFIPFQKEDLVGFIDTTGKVQIPPSFEQALPFSEELSVVMLGDSAWYINKMGYNVLGKKFEEALPFQNNVAPVKKNNQWFFINHVGQAVSDTFQEIAEFKGGRYVVRKNDLYGTLDAHLQTIIEPTFEKLGDFKNGYAYYQQNGLFGYVNLNGFRSAADYEWISEFNTDGCALVRKQNHFGLIHPLKNSSLPIEYDQILKVSEGIYLIIKNGKYGFYSTNACFVFLPIFEYNKDQPVTYYSNGVLFRLLKKNKITIATANGCSINLSENAPDEFWLSTNALLLARKGKKFGYINANGKTEIPFRYSEAFDFSDDLALVREKEFYKLINRIGTEIIASEDKPEKISKSCWLVQTDSRLVVHHSGKILAYNVENIQALHGWLVITLSDGTYKIIRD